MFGRSWRIAMETLGAQYRDEVAFLRSRVQYLEEEVLRMRRQGFDFVDRPGEIEDHVGRSIPQEVQEAIERRAQPGSRLAEDLGQYARSQLAMNVPTEILVRSILRGQRPTGDADGE